MTTTSAPAPSTAPAVSSVLVPPCIERISLVNPRAYRLLIVFTDGSKLEVNGRLWYDEFAALARTGTRIVVTPGIVSFQMRV